MGDCLLALQQCSLIGLDESPSLLRQSMLRSVSELALQRSCWGHPLVAVRAAWWHALLLNP